MQSIKLPEENKMSGKDKSIICLLVMFGWIGVGVLNIIEKKAISSIIIDFVAALIFLLLALFLRRKK